MKKKQIKLTVTRDMYDSLTEMAKLHNLPLSSYIRLFLTNNLVSRGEVTGATSENVDVVADMTEPVSVDESENEDVILLSDILNPKVISDQIGDVNLESIVEDSSISTSSPQISPDSQSAVESGESKVIGIDNQTQSQDKVVNINIYLDKSK